MLRFMHGESRDNKDSIILIEKARPFVQTI